MFKRVILEGQYEFVPYICFALVAGVFLTILIRAIRMKSTEASRLASMPLLDDEELRNTREKQLTDTAR